MEKQILGRKYDRFSANTFRSFAKFVRSLNERQGLLFTCHKSKQTSQRAKPGF